VTATDGSSLGRALGVLAGAAARALRRTRAAEARGPVWHDATTRTPDALIRYGPYGAVREVDAAPAPDAGETLAEAIEVIVRVYKLDDHSAPVARDLRRIAAEFGPRGRSEGPP
jgi:hypothetical protein